MEDKVAKLGLAVKGYKDTITVVQFKYKIHISQLQMKLQVTTPQDVRDQRETNLKATIVSISATVEDCGKFLDESLQI